MPPSFDHDGLVEIFRARPSLAAELLRALGIDVPETAQATTDTANLTELQPAEYRADLFVLLEGAGGWRMGVVVEVQLEPDPEKRYTWPAYQAVSRARHRCPVVVLVFTPGRSVAKWAAEPVQLGGGSVFVPEVVGPDAVAAIDDPAKARENVELAVLSAIAHAQSKDAELAGRVAAAAGNATLGVPGRAGALYWDLIESALGPAAKAALEALMPLETYQFKGETAVKNQAIGRAESIVAVLEARGLPITEVQRAHIMQTTDRDTLDHLVRKAATVDSTEELFED